MERCMQTKLIAIVAIAVMAVGGGAYFLFIKDDSTSNTTGSNSASSNITKQSDSSSSSATAVKLAKQEVGKETDCSLYTLDELKTVWGVPMVDTDIGKVQQLSTQGGKLYSCGYNETDSGLGLTFSIEYREHADVESAKQSIADTRSTEKYGETKYYNLEEKSGVGDEAFFWTKYRTDGSKEVNQQMYIRKDNVVFLLSGVNISGIGADYKEKLVASYKLHFE